MRISAAQVRPVRGDIAANLSVHKKLIALAVSMKADAVFFPELSITGYEPQLAGELATDKEDILLDDLQKISDDHKIIIGVGLPTISNSGIHISMVIMQPGLVREIYSKQQLHSDELPYFIRGEEQMIINANHMNIAPAICYESLQADHAENAFKLGAEVYAASVAKSQSGIDKAILHYPAIARKYSMPVLMANCVGYCDNFISAGQSAVWTKRGELVAQLDRDSQGVLTFDTETEETIKETL